jgi:hypothetical protein
MSSDRSWRSCATMASRRSGAQMQCSQRGSLPHGEQAAMSLGSRRRRGERYSKLSPRQCPKQGASRADEATHPRCWPRYTFTARVVPSGRERQAHMPPRLGDDAPAAALKASSVFRSAAGKSGPASMTPRMRSGRSLRAAAAQARQRCAPCEVYAQAAHQTRAPEGVCRASAERLSRTEPCAVLATHRRQSTRRRRRSARRAAAGRASPRRWPRRARGSWRRGMAMSGALLSKTRARRGRLTCR